MRAATYARLSDDGLSIPDQLASSRKYAEDRGWHVVGEFVDKHKSAFRKVERKGFEALLTAADAGKIDAIITRHQDRLTRHPQTYGRLLEICVRHSILIHLYTGGVLDLATHAGGFMGMMNTAVAWGESKLRSDRVKAAVQRNAEAGRRTGGGSRPFGYKIIYQDLGEGAKRQRRIIGEELEPAEADAVREAVSRVLRGESLRSIAFDFNKRGIKPAGGKKNGESKIDKWQGSTLRRVLISPRIAGLREHNGEVVGKAVCPGIIDEATHDRLVGLLKNPSRRPLNYGRSRLHPLAGLVYCGSCGGRLVSHLQPRQGRGYGCRKDENPDCEARVRIVAEPLEAYIEGYVIDQWRNPRARKIAQSDDDRLKRIAEVSAEMAELQRQKQDAFRMKLRREVDLQTFKAITKEIDTALDQLDRDHKSLTSEAAMPELPDPSLAWEDLSALDRRALTEMLVDKIIIKRHPSKIDQDGKRHYLIRAIPYQDPEQEAERLKAVHQARVKIVPRA